MSIASIAPESGLTLELGGRCRPASIRREDVADRPLPATVTHRGGRPNVPQNRIRTASDRSAARFQTARARADALGLAVTVGIGIRRWVPVAVVRVATTTLCPAMAILAVVGVSGSSAWSRPMPDPGMCQP